MLLALALQVSVLTNAHAHNDYGHARPLFDALEQGFVSVEADVFLVEGELRVGHDRQGLRPGRTLDALYLKPLYERWKKWKSVYAQKTPFTLLVDIKADGEAVWARLERDLKPYRPMLQRVERRKLVKGAVSVVLSGDRPIATLSRLDSREAFIDGRLPDLDSDPSPLLIPLVSASYTDTFATPRADLSDDRRTKLADIVRRAHAQGRRVRFWAAPDDEPGWTLLQAAGVDLINTDKLKELRTFLTRK
ncbi:MAG: phosphatidylinositol-specific phospholipase C/glycerophosphodiester phosphodiesterase family protein [Armatimonadetes bacterium]|nr:phosphatidylinositol-specific phospholipase C/glycerophosphodiester phosphodiesterase family protein [Armatimonadota bacterium]